MDNDYSWEGLFKKGIKLEYKIPMSYRGIWIEISYLSMLRAIIDRNSYYRNFVIRVKKC